MSCKVEHLQPTLQLQDLPLGLGLSWKGRASGWTMCLLKFVNCPHIEHSDGNKKKIGYTYKIPGK